MACYKPIDAYRGLRRTAKGKLPVVFDRRESNGQAIKIACGRCIGCRIDHSRMWAIRCVHEAQLHEQNCFITLTYNDKHLPEDEGLCKKHFQDFMKRLREHYEPKKIRFFHCGEYGERLSRPHYHALLFGHDFSDKILWKDQRGFKIYTSPTLEKLWPKGFSTIAAVNFETAAYVSRYVLKKRNGEQAKTHYQKINPETGEIFDVQSEYITMSRNKGIAYEWFKKFGSDVFPSDEVILQGKKLKPPKYYATLFEHDHQELFNDVRKKRHEKSKRYKPDQTQDRLDARHRCALAKNKARTRSYETG